MTKGKQVLDLTPDFKIIEQKLTDLSKHFASEVQSIKHNLRMLRAKIAEEDCAAQPSKILAVEDRIQDLRDEVLEAFARLENMDVDG